MDESELSLCIIAVVGASARISIPSCNVLYGAGLGSASR